jgi:hypothetical protein
MWFRKNKYGNRDEALQLLEEKLKNRRNLTYNELIAWVGSKKIESTDLRSKSGIAYQLEFYAIWDDKKQKTIRFWGTIDGGDISAYSPLSSSFIKAVNNTFVDE